MLTVGRYLNPIDAELDRIKLEQSEINGVVRAGTEFNPLVMGAGGETQLLVDEADAERARSVLRHIDVEPPDDEQDVRCPACNGVYCYFEAHRSDLPVPDAILAITDTLSEPLTRWSCRTCSHRWDDPNEAARLGRVDTSLPSPVFRLRRNALIIGALVGLMTGFVVAAAVGGFLGASALVLVLAGGCLIGGSITNDTCSQPGCGEPLSPGEDSCRSCGGVVSGVITRAIDHHRQATAVRRSLAVALEQPEAEGTSLEPPPRRRGTRLRRARGKL